MTTNTVAWEAPPPHGNRDHKWDEVAEALKSRPGEWAKVADDVASSTVSAISAARIAAFQPPGSFQARGQMVRKGRSTVWVRYVGPTNS